MKVVSKNVGVMSVTAVFLGLLVAWQFVGCAEQSGPGPAEVKQQAQSEQETAAEQSDVTVPRTETEEQPHGQVAKQRPEKGEQGRQQEKAAAQAEQPDIVKFTMFFTSDTRGRIEDCGCPGKPKGGLPRRATALRAYAKGQPLIVDAGNMNTPTQSFILLNWQYGLRMMGRMKCDVANIGQTELQVSKANLLRVAKESPVPLISANVLDADTSQPVLPTHVVLQRFGKRIAVVGVVYHAYEDMQVSEDYRVAPAGPALQRVLDELAGRYDFLVLLADMPLVQARILVRDYPQIGLVVLTQQKSRMEQPVQENSTWLVEAGRGDYRLAELTAEMKENRLEKVHVREFKLGLETKEDKELKDMIEEYNQRLHKRISGIKGASKVKRWWHLYKEKKVRSWYAGAAECAQCHREDYKLWSRSDHAHAYSTLVEANRHSNPDCLRCHTVGFNEAAGFKLDEFSEHLRGVQCESCHGEASNHALKERGQRPSGKVALREFKDEADIEAMCKTCHDEANSPEFEYSKYWKQIKHGAPAKVPEAIKARTRRAARTRPGPPATQGTQAQARPLKKIQPSSAPATQP